MPVNIADSSSSSKRSKCQTRDDDDEYYLFTLSDNDFITNNGEFGWLGGAVVRRSEVLTCH